MFLSGQRDVVSQKHHLRVPSLRYDSLTAVSLAEEPGARLKLTNRTSLCLPKGLGGSEVVKPRCVPGVCFREDMCVETAGGVECGPCPDGYTGDGFNCDDVDEVRTVFLRHSSRKVYFSHWYSRLSAQLRTRESRCSLMEVLAEGCFSVQQLESIKLYWC